MSAAVADDGESPSAESPSDWLLARFETLNKAERGGSVGHVRPIFQVIDDHAGSECESYSANGTCRWLSGDARWPDPQTHHVITAIPALDNN